MTASRHIMCFINIGRDRPHVHADVPGPCSVVIGGGDLIEGGLACPRGSSTGDRDRESGAACAAGQRSWDWHQRRARHLDL